MGWASLPFGLSVLPQLVPKLSRNYLKEGYMEKTGPKVGAEQQTFRSVKGQPSCFCLSGGCLRSGWVLGHWTHWASPFPGASRVS